MQEAAPGARRSAFAAGARRLSLSVGATGHSAPSSTSAPTKLSWRAQNWSQTTADADDGWNENRRMHVASVSKFITAMGIVKALGSSGISPEATIGPAPPRLLEQGQQRRRHHVPAPADAPVAFLGQEFGSEHGFMRGRVAAGVSAVPGVITKT